MRLAGLPPMAIASILLSITSQAFASKITPCAACDSCDASKAIDVNYWNDTNWVNDFSMPTAASKDGDYFDVFWQIEQPDQDCRINIFAPFKLTQGSTKPGLTGQILVSAANKVCINSRVYGNTVGAGACCGEDCVNIGAIPGQPTASKREIAEKSLSRIMRSAVSSDLDYPTIEQSVKAPVLSSANKRTNPNPWQHTQQPGPDWSCTKTSTGRVSLKSGRQQVQDLAQNCGTSATCNLGFTLSVSVASTLSSESSTTYTDSQGHSIEVAGGYMGVGPMLTVTDAKSVEFSKALADSVGLSNTQTQTSEVNPKWDNLPGTDNLGWTSPTYNCEVFTITCSDGSNGQGDWELCTPNLGQDGKPVYEFGVMMVS